MCEHYFNITQNTLVFERKFIPKAYSIQKELSNFFNEYSVFISYNIKNAHLKIPDDPNSLIKDYDVDVNIIPGFKFGRLTTGVYRLLYN